MTDFGRRDFGNALKKLFEADTVEPDEIGAFQGDAKIKSIKGKDELDGMSTGKTGIGGQVKAFAKLWKGVKDTLKKHSDTVSAALTQFETENPDLVYSGRKTSRAAATAAALGDKTAAAGKFDAADAADLAGQKTASSNGKNPNTMSISGDDIRGSRKRKTVAPAFQAQGTPTDGAKADFAASQVQGPSVERERVNRDRKKRAAAATTGGTNV